MKEWRTVWVFSGDLTDPKEREKLTRFIGGMSPVEMEKWTASNGWMPDPQDLINYILAQRQLREKQFREMVRRRTDIARKK